MACVGMGLGGGFEDTHKLHVMKYNEAMATKDTKGWQASTDDKHVQMVKEWKAIPPGAAPKGCKIINAMWAMKKKAIRALRARVTARGFMQVAGVHYDPKTIAAPVTNEMMIQIILTLMIMAVRCEGGVLTWRLWSQRSTHCHEDPTENRKVLSKRLFVVAVEDNIRSQASSVCVLEGAVESRAQIKQDKPLQ
jgi:hypothetical protein